MTGLLNSLLGEGFWNDEYQPIIRRTDMFEGTITNISIQYKPRRRELIKRGAKLRVRIRRLDR